jgi:uncharacterized protein YegL
MVRVHEKCALFLFLKTNNLPKLSAISYNVHMPSWSHRRQLLYLLIPLVLALGAYAFIYSKYIYSPATCFDGVKNGTETGVDCGGTCALLCKGDVLTPVVLWAKSFNVSGSVWNSVAYIQNSNLTSSAKSVQYVFRLYDANNAVVVTRTGSIDIPANKTFAVFEGGISTGNVVIKHTDFSFSNDPTWQVDTTKSPNLSISNDPVVNASTSPKISGTITNQTLETVGPVELVALIFDGRQNAIGASKTVIDPLASGASSNFIFTWPHPFPVGIDVCEDPSNVMLVLDRSGSMRSTSVNPPEPLNSVKQTAIDFISQLSYGDSVGVVSFGTTPSNPIDQSLSSNIENATGAVSLINISTSTADQNTNIGDALQKASDELLSPQADPTLKKVIVLLTDGIPTDPQKQGVSNYPTLYAENSASQARAQGISIYTIGLGNQVNQDILSNIAGAPERFFSAPDTNTLASIYSQIESSICVRKPNVIEILPRVL